ncbi:hypothetical protein H9L39_16104 [Fusarium oxysporum f. sp. albedinis]|nr:hypothetical protein H9L39_16104 [Fusarium oxysporum f. sp. albedinis]
MGLPFSPKSQGTSQAVPEHSQSDSEAPIIRDGDLTHLIIIFLNLNHMVGTGIFSTPATILRLIGSVGLALVY